MTSQDSKAAMQAQLVDIRQLGTQKVSKLTLHIPVEYTPLAIDIFGWPTGANPVPVAVARLNETAAPEG